MPVTVVIGNPPYAERAEGMGGWIEKGSAATRNDKKSVAKAKLDDFRMPGNGLTEYVLKNLYIYFWRWATWKVFESVPADQAGVVCFISTAGYLRGPGFKGMRSYLRREADEGWIIDLTPEGQTPDVPSRIFPGVRQQLAIGIFVRRADHDAATPAPIQYRSLHGKQADKFRALAQLDLTTGWERARDGLTEPLTPAAGAWDAFPAVGDLLAWVSPGVKANRTWVYAPSAAILRDRWSTLRTSRGTSNFVSNFKVTRDSRVDQGKAPLSGSASVDSTVGLDKSMDGEPDTSRVSYRSLDRQWIVSDHRVIDQARPDLWAANEAARSVFVNEQHSKPISSGPALTFSALLPDMDNFKGSEGGRTLPLLHPDGTPNLAPGLLEGLAAEASIQADHEDLLAYVAGVVAHPAFTATFVDELTTPGVRVPITRDVALWARAVELGREVIWLHTYAERYVDPAAGREAGNVRSGWPMDAQPKSLEAVTTMPVKLQYDDVRGHIVFTDDDGDRNGAWGPVPREVFDYTVGGMNVISSWFKYRKKNPGGKKTSPLDDIHVDEWPHEWTLEFTELLTVLTRLVSLEPAQAELLEQVLAGSLITKDELASAGVRWPETRDDRKPRRKVAANTLDIFGDETE
ncbi:MAG: hypothetical protein KIT89_00300 [Microcella sp.]|uniref:type ISP restriction/modification enzyme n=1 Tax=Microcella sp. TaxID=1913979 RepID=UPI0024C78390|nr:type ISP restriction/modification enzyme [Microcella sp.]UYN83728.1 MAG: hypothetical protein KIT89_00300 [Microcella sp.]